MKIDLVYPASVSGSENYSSEPPLGPIALYSSLPEEWRRDVRFLDSTLMPQAEIERLLVERRPDVLAVSCTTFNYRNAIQLAGLAKSVGAQVVLGGIHITYLRDAILNKMRRGGLPVDYLVSSYGEPAFHGLLLALSEGAAVSAIPNLSYVADGRAVVNVVVGSRGGPDPLNVPLDYGQIDFRRYSERFQRYGNVATATVAASTFTQRGCAYAGARKCTFCSIEQINPRRPMHLFEEDVVTLVERHGADHIRIDDGDFTVDVRHMLNVAEAADRAAARTGRRPTFYCFARADEIDQKRIEALKKLNVVSVFIGYESGSDRMLRSMHKFTTRSQNLAATRLLKEHGIDVLCAGLVLGADGETEATLHETLDFVNDLHTIGNVHSLVATPMIPLPGSPSFHTLLQELTRQDPGKHRQLSQSDDFDIEELLSIWNRYMSQVPLSRLLEVSDDIAAQFRIGIRFLDLPRKVDGIIQRARAVDASPSPRGA